MASQEAQGPSLASGGVWTHTGPPGETPCLAVLSDGAGAARVRQQDDLGILNKESPHPREQESYPLPLTPT